MFHQSQESTNSNINQELLNHLRKVILDYSSSCLNQSNKLDKIHNTESVNIFCALSGGLDSVVLLDLLYKLKTEDLGLCDQSKERRGNGVQIIAVYIDHQLQPDSKQWHEFTKKLARHYNIDYICNTVTVKNHKGTSLEQEAREARYNSFAKLITNNNKILLTAHHLNDQAETFLLQLVRSAGPKGLSAMPGIKKFADGYHMRPLLTISRNKLEQYAKLNKLSWVEDKTNLDVKYDRNYIRNKVLPVLQERWPNFISQVAASSYNCAEHELVLNQYLEQDYNKIAVDKNHFGLKYKVLDITKLLNYTIEQQRLLIRYWLNYVGANLPSRKVLEQIIKNCLNSSSDAMPEVKVNNYIITKYKNYLYCILNYKIDSILGNKSEDRYSSSIRYMLGENLSIDVGTENKKLYKLKISSEYIYHPNINHKNLMLNIPENTELKVKFRQAGLTCKPVGRNGTVSIKKLLNENNVPPWLRDFIPLVFIDHCISCVAGISVCEPYACNYKNRQPGWALAFDLTIITNH